MVAVAEKLGYKPLHKGDPRNRLLTPSHKLPL
jgi:hypothetical protein